MNVVVLFLANMLIMVTIVIYFINSISNEHVSLLSKVLNTYFWFVSFFSLALLPLEVGLTLSGSKEDDGMYYLWIVQYWVNMFNGQVFLAFILVYINSGHYIRSKKIRSSFFSVGIRLIIKIILLAIGTGLIFFICDIFKIRQSFEELKTGAFKLLNTFYYLLFVCALSFGLINVPLKQFRIRNLQKYRHWLITSLYYHRSRVAATQQEIKDYIDLSNDLLKVTADQALKEHIYAIQDEGNRCQVFHLANQPPNRESFDQTIFQHRFRITEDILVKFLSKIKSLNFKNQFNRGRYFTYLIEYYFYTDIQNQLKNSASLSTRVDSLQCKAGWIYSPYRDWYFKRVRRPFLNFLAFSFLSMSIMLIIFEFCMIYDMKILRIVLDKLPLSGPWLWVGVYGLVVPLLLFLVFCVYNFLYHIYWFDTFGIRPNQMSEERSIFSCASILSYFSGSFCKYFLGLVLTEEEITKSTNYARALTNLDFIKIDGQDVVYYFHIIIVIVAILMFFSIFEHTLSIMSFKNFKTKKPLSPTEIAEQEALLEHYSDDNLDQIRHYYHILSLNNENYDSYLRYS